MSTPTGFDGQVLPVEGSDETRAVTANDVVYGGKIVGTDPDEAVRAELLRDASSKDSSGSDGGS